MLTYQDYINTDDKANFILKAIDKFTMSDEYQTALTAQKYYSGSNVEILKRLQWFYNSKGSRVQDKFKANNQICNEFFHKIVKQEVSYLLANGVTVDDDIKEELGVTFDRNIMQSGLYSIVDGVSWILCFMDSGGKFGTQVFRGTELIPLFDEVNNQLRACIRFWQTTADKPVYIELYEEDGKTTFVKEKKIKLLRIIEPKTNYFKKISKDKFGEKILAEHSEGIPIVPIFANDLKRSELSVALKSKLDLYDVIMSDFGNNLEDSQDVYWVLKNYQGQDMGEFLADYKYYKTIKVDEQGSAEANTIDVPYQARKEALDILRKQIFDDAMALDTSVLNGGSLTNVAIKANMQNLDLKVDTFEMEMINSISKIIDILLKFKNKSERNYNISFIRRSLINDTEIVDNIYKMRNDISLETALRLNPYIEDPTEEIKKMELEGIDKYKIEEV